MDQPLDEPRSSSAGEDYDNRIVLTIPSTRLVLRLSGLKYIAFTVLGMALLWPWNCFLSASEYFTERFSSKPLLANNYSSTMMTISTLTSTLFNLYLSQRQKDVDYAARVRLGQRLTIFVFLLMGLSCLVGTNSSPVMVFVFVMINVFLSSVGTCLSQVGCMALVNVMKPLYANAVVVGSAIAGVLPSIALIASTVSIKASTEETTQASDRNSAVAVYFFTACAVSAIALVLFWLCERFDDLKPDTPPASQSYIPLANEDPDSVFSADSGPSDDDIIKTVEQQQHSHIHVPFSVLWAKLKLLVLTIFFTFSVTLIFPVYASAIESVNHDSHPDSLWFTKRVFIPLAFLVWNIGDLVGRLACSLPIFVLSSQKMMIIYSLSRLLFIPVFYCCNIQNKGALFIFDSDIVYMVALLAFGFSNGQLYSSCFMSVSQYMDTEEEKKAASGFTAVFLSCGLAFGSLASYLFVALIY
ncbi:unnamed protein product [Kuraishia capsulata CBS 1993]|uniref:Nucleoside transporter n=1 Tax=Kuraishia capsulata CBS 1993 TaxID=1382522 RepID=W6ML97_9ASCO|nr:uncharacterized protein KUCA_T00003219001 [Kuraishia capsulata CBS 1993]CDK27241.1 unnamed protein product [Kuraishia capsulata CBS 1993]